MKISYLPILATGFMLSACNSASDTQEQTKQNKQLKIVSWNIEHLADHPNQGCKPRSEADYSQLAQYAASLDADIIALQEVQSKTALARVFPTEQWRFVVSQRPNNEAYECRGLEGQWSTPQRTAFAIKKTVAFSEPAQFKALAMGNPGLRYGVQIQLTQHPAKLTLLNVHMKSGCFVDDYQQSDKKSCVTYQGQAPILENWINQQITQQPGVIVLGDFNHRLSSAGNVFWQQLKNENNKTVLSNVMEGIESCHPKYKALIDHILVDEKANQYVHKASAKVDYFNQTPPLDYADMLSDHCPISVTLQH